jgi:hypothetical protein
MQVLTLAKLYGIKVWFYCEHFEEHVGKAIGNHLEHGVLHKMLKKNLTHQPHQNPKRKKKDGPSWLHVE